MAIKLENKTNVTAPGGDYPYGNIKDDTGVGDGTPVDKQVYADFHQFFARMLALSGITANNLPDNQTNTFQYYLALKKLANIPTALVTLGATTIDGYTFTLTDSRFVKFSDPSNATNAITLNATNTVPGTKVLAIFTGGSGDVLSFSGMSNIYIRTGTASLTLANDGIIYVTIEVMGANDAVVDIINGGL